MTTYISILRGINVSGHRMIKMQTLKELFTDLGFENIQTYIQSGNIVFQHKKTDPQKLEKKIAKAITEKSTFDVPVIVKKLEELQQIIAANPFLKDKTKELAHLHITFLTDEPDTESVNKIKAGSYQPDEFYLVNKVIYLYCPNNYGNSKLTNGFFEKKLSLTATTRNWKTTNELINIALKISN
jgi:uncharacterized protein (DUF1697 family)